MMHDTHVRRTTLYVQGCLTWLHTSDASSAKIGAVLCPPFGQEEICTHYGMMELADELAASGIPTVRFDYRGTGNSTPHEISLRSMVEDVSRAADFLRSEITGCSVVLIGLRLGAMVALQASERMPSLQGIVFMAPILAGAAYLRETRAAAAVARLAALDPVRPQDDWLPLNTNGFQWTGALQREIFEADAARMKPPAVPVLLLPSPQDRTSPKLAATWCSNGSVVTQHAFMEYGAWMQDPTTHTSPIEAFAQARRWIAAQTRADVRTTHRDVETWPMLRGDGFIETPMHFGADKKLFGILTLPVEGGATPIAALLLHEGSSHTIGNGGAYVTLARRMAKEGIVSFRMDLSAVGDSVENGNTRHPHYDHERIPESVAALDLLGELGYPMAAVFGLCSGAYTAYQVSLADTRIVGSVLTNLQKFVWTYGTDIRVQHKDNKRSFKGYLRAMRSAGEWKRALTGKGDIKGIVRVMCKRSVARVTHAVKMLLPPAPDSEMAVVHGQMKALAKRGVMTHLIFGDDDPGLAEMWMQFGRRAFRLAHFAPARMVILEDADHHFNASSARRRYYDLAVGMMHDILREHGARANEGADAERRARRRKQRPSRISTIRATWRAPQPAAA